jgi:hypothetical protein
MRTREIAIDLEHPVDNFARIDAVMLFPNDVASQDQYVAMIAAERERAKRREEYHFSQLTRSTLLTTFDARHAREAAGLVFWLLATMLVHHQKQASIAKAQFLCARLCPRSHLRTIKKHWAEYRTCAHLHAAAFLAEYAYKKDMRSADAWVVRAAHYMLGECLRVDNGKLRDGWWAVTDPDFWKPPDDFVIQPLSAPTLELLSQYRAPTSVK